MECQDKNEYSVLLLDEAGLTLHPTAQKDLAAFFNRLAQNNQIINTTHSPFIVDPGRIDRCRVVFSDENGSTVVSQDLRAGAGEVGTKSIYALHAALGLTVSDVMFQGCQVVLVEGPSDQYYLSAIKNELIRNNKFIPKKEIVFAPAGGVKAVSYIAGLVSSKNDSLPFIILDSDKNGEDFKKKLVGDLYKDCKERIINVEDITKIKQSEIEDIIPFDFMSRSLERIWGIRDEEDSEFIPQKGKPILPQIEAYAEKEGIMLSPGWKVDIARSFRGALERKRESLSEEYKEMWISLFNKLNQ